MLKMGSSILYMLITYKYPLIFTTWGYAIACAEKQIRWGRYANKIYTNPFYPVIGLGIGYAIKNTAFIYSHITDTIQHTNY